ncbi:MAG: hypothetical protein IID61_19225 [SAR324 cluster bacterium]|nr:hypothetical protein [SAR324 cluster bacterium]
MFVIGACAAPAVGRFDVIRFDVIRFDVIRFGMIVLSAFGPKNSKIANRTH